MRVGRVAMGALVSAALLVGSVTPAMARDGWGRDRWGQGGWDRGWDRGRHRDNFDFGDAVGIAALIGAAVIVMNSMNKDKKAREGSAAGLPPEKDGAGKDYMDSRDYRDGEGSGAGDLASADRAVDACAVAARDEAASGGGYAEVRDMGEPKAVSDGWDVDGTVEQRTGYRDSAGKVRRFTCSIRGGRVAEVYLSREPATI
ncbi:MAG: hypothetical protein DI547_10170 [Sphingobium sp.]|nr:MAG: hypothetical protein DI547_10170 [Sphingobium sp.]